jgi:hypothetical protein
MADWERSHDWVLIRFDRHYTKIIIYFQQDKPSTDELMTIRRCLLGFSNASPAKLRTLIIEAGGLFLDKMPSSDAARVIESIQGQGLYIVVENRSVTSYLPIDRTTDRALLISNKFEKDRISEEMIAAGVPIEKIEDYKINDD